MKLNSLLTTLRQKGYQIYTLPFQLNIVAERSATVRSEVMDDTLHIFYADQNGKFTLYSYLVTTDPSAYYIDNPIVPQGYGFIRKGQYVGAYQKGYHKGRPALVQVKPITVVRNYDTKGLFRKVTGSEQTGTFGNNIHDMKGSMFNASAGCIVFAHAADHAHFMKMVADHARIYGNAFTLTMIDFRDAAKVRNTSWLAGGLALAGLTTIGYYSHKNL